MSMLLDDWLQVVRREYLDDFIRAGGAAVKFVVPNGEQRPVGLWEQLRATAEASGFQFALVDAAATRLHLIDKLFQEVARQVDWDALATAFLTRLLTDQSLLLPASLADFNLATIATLNDYPEPLLQSRIDRWVLKQIFADYAMSQEFRYALIQLCRAKLAPTDDPALAQAVEEWLRGELRLVSAVKRALIFQKVARHNARHLLFSLAHWLHVAGRSGLVLGLDISRYAEATRMSERSSGFYYSAAAALDAYEVLRQLIDATDELEHCLVVVFASTAFVADDRRGLRSYQALTMRIADDVRDRYRQNPLASLVRVAVPALAEPALAGE